MPVDFQTHKNEIFKALTEKGKLVGNWSILDFFVNQPIQKEISGNVIIGGPSLPLVVVMNQDTGEVKYFSLKFLLGNKVSF
jgi:hypothetical protein